MCAVRQYLPLGTTQDGVPRFACKDALLIKCKDCHRSYPRVVDREMMDKLMFWYIPGGLMNPSHDDSERLERCHHHLFRPYGSAEHIQLSEV